MFRTSNCLSSVAILYKQLTVFHMHLKWRVVAKEFFLMLKNYRGSDKSLARPTSRCILFDGGNISFDVSLVVYVNSIHIPPNMIINKIYENQNILSL
jgi:hypothetical protein